MNAPEQRVADRLKADGWKVVRNGWPDFLCIRGEEIKAVEVKRAGEIQPHQVKNHDILRSASIPVEVVVEGRQDTPEHVAVNIRMPHNLWEKVHKLAQQSDRSLSKTIIVLLRGSLEVGVK